MTGFRSPLPRGAVLAVVAGLVTGTSACSKRTPADGAPAAGSSAQEPASSASASRPSSVAVAPVPTAVTWTGAYTSTPGSLYVYDGGEWRGVHFRGDDASDGLGQGTLSFTVDSTTHRVLGTGSGPVGEVVITGAVTKDELTFSVLRKDTTDRGLTGTGTAKVAPTSVDGVMRLSRGDAHVIREAKFTLSKASP